MTDWSTEPEGGYIASAPADIPEVEYAPGELRERQDPHRRAGSDPVLVSNVRAALRLLSPEHITPVGVRVIEKVLAAAEEKKH